MNLAVPQVQTVSNDFNNNPTKKQISPMESQSSLLETTITSPVYVKNELHDLIEHEFQEYKKLNENIYNLEDRLNKLEENMIKK